MHPCRSAITRTLTAIMFLALAASVTHAAIQSGATVVISQIYTPGGGGGGSSGFNHSYIELHNRSAVAVSLDGWSLQYAQSSSSTWGLTPLFGTMQPGQFFLVAEDNFFGGGNPLPPADVTGSTFIYPAGGKAVLLSSMVPMSGCGAGLPVVDLLGYGGTDCSEGGATAPPLSPSVALFRSDTGCQDTDINFTDFALGSPAPRNSTTPVHLCSTGPTGTSQITPSMVVAGAVAQLTVNVTPGQVPASTGLYVLVDLSSLGGSPSQPLYDDGTHGDATPSDNVFNLSYILPFGATPGTHVLTFTIEDAQLRSFTTTAEFVILPPVVVSQIYTPGGGGGGSFGFNHSYIELHNRGPAPVAIDGWSLQCANFSNNTWNITPLSGTIQPGQYLLVQEGNAGGGNPLPPADLFGSAFLTPAGGKIALMASTESILTACPVGLPVVDFVGYGSTDCYEGGASAPSMSPATANFRKGQGCRDTDVNSADFALGTGAPRNSGSPFVTCTQSTSAPLSGPQRFALRGAIPNPSSRELVLSFTLVNSAHATLALMDVAGRIVVSREVGSMGPGEHIVRLADVSRLAPGIYLARLSQFNMSATSRVVVTR